MEQTQTYRIFWQKRQDGGARLLRICGMSSHVCIPSQIAGHPVVEIAPYCFAGNGRQLPRGYETTLTGDRELFLEELCGAAVEHVSLPDTVKEIGNCAFYNCRKLNAAYGRIRLFHRQRCFYEYNFAAQDFVSVSGG